MRKRYCVIGRDNMREGEPWARFENIITGGNIIRSVLDLVMKDQEVVEGDGIHITRGRKLSV